MFEVTKNDLSGGEAIFDLKAMTVTAEIAVSLLMQEVFKYHTQLGEDYRKKYPTGIELNAKWLERAAKQLVTTAEMLAVLYGSSDRETLTIIR